MRCNDLKERKGVADVVGCLCCEIRWGKHWVYSYDLLEESWHDTWQLSQDVSSDDDGYNRKARLTEFVPYDEGEVMVLLALVGEDDESSLSDFGIQELHDEGVEVVIGGDG